MKIGKKDPPLIGLQLTDLTNLVSLIQSQIRKSLYKHLRNTLSHEHLTPINQILSMAKLLLSDYNSSERAQQARSTPANQQVDGWHKQEEPLSSRTHKVERSVSGRLRDFNPL